MNDPDNQLPTVLFLMGPTASGKTELAVELVEKLPCEIISVDSALIYKDMDIGTAKPDAETLARAPHRLIDILDPAESYSVARFRNEALAAIEDILAAGRIPLLVGGTMMYYRALYYGLSELPESDQQVRAALEAEADVKGLEAMHRRLAEVDPQAAERIHKNDPQRILRALEVYEISGQPLSELQQATAGQQGFPCHAIRMVLSPSDRSVLHERIAQRFLKMLELGFIDEVKALYERGDLDLSMPSMRAVGYRQVWEYLAGELDYEQMIERGIIATRQLAKRQLTWLRGEPDLHWFDALDPDVNAKVLAFLASEGLKPG